MKMQRVSGFAVAVGGFSGRATRLLARALATRAEDFWPPVYQAQGLQIGAFIVQFTMPAGKKEVDILRTDLVATADVTPIPAEAIARSRLGAKAQTAKKVSASLCGTQFRSLPLI